MTSRSLLEVPITDARHQLGVLIQTCRMEDVVATRHGHPAAVLVSADRYAALVDKQAMEQSTDSEVTDLTL